MNASARLLTRLGYGRVDSGWPGLRSYDPGDLVCQMSVSR